MMIEISYILIYLAVVVAIGFGIKKATTGSNTNLFKIFLGFNFIWLAYLYILSSTELLFERSLPSLFAIFVFIPILIILFIGLFFITKNGLHKNIPKSWPVYFQTFRVLMEQVILVTAYRKILPMEATYLGYNFEFYFALTAPFIAYFAFHKQLLPKSVVILWNVAGIIFLIIVVTIVATAFASPGLWGYQNEMVKDEFATLPWLLLPALIVPSAIFMHLFSITQLVKR